MFVRTESLPQTLQQHMTVRVHIPIGTAVVLWRGDPREADGRHLIEWTVDEDLQRGENTLPAAVAEPKLRQEGDRVVMNGRLHLTDDGTAYLQVGYWSVLFDLTSPIPDGVDGSWVQISVGSESVALYPYRAWQGNLKGGLPRNRAPSRLRPPSWPSRPGNRCVAARAGPAPTGPAGLSGQMLVRLGLEGSSHQMLGRLGRQPALAQQPQPLPTDLPGRERGQLLQQLSGQTVRRHRHRLHAGTLITAVGHGKRHAAEGLAGRGPEEGRADHRGARHPPCHRVQ